MSNPDKSRPDLLHKPFLAELPRLLTIYPLSNTFKFTKCRSPIVRTLYESLHDKETGRKKKELKMDHRSSIPFLAVL